jgi:hypothetical protein
MKKVTKKIKAIFMNIFIQTSLIKPIIMKVSVIVYTKKCSSDIQDGKSFECSLPHRNTNLNT